MKPKHLAIIITVFFLTLLILLLIPKSVAVPEIQAPVEELPQPYVLSEIGVASYYDYTLDDGWSSLGHRVCATRNWDRYSYIKVTNVANGKSVVCKVTDYGPEEAIFPERIVDLSSYSFSQIADLKLGIINVTITYEERS